MRRWRVLLTVLTVLCTAFGLVALTDGSAPNPPGTAADPADDTVLPPHRVPFGLFLGSDESDAAETRLSEWLGGAPIQVGHTYLPGNHWDDIEGSPSLLGAWAAWKGEQSDRLLVIGTPMLPDNEAGVPDEEVRQELREGADGQNDAHFTLLAQRLVALGLPDAVLTLGWEMNGTTYTSRCGPDPAAWKAYWRRVVDAMRTVPGQHLRFEFAPTRARTPTRGPTATPATTSPTSWGWTATTWPRTTPTSPATSTPTSTSPTGCWRRCASPSSTQAGVLSGVGDVQPGRRPGVRAADAGLDQHPRHPLPDRHRLLPARGVALPEQPKASGVFRRMLSVSPPSPSAAATRPPRRPPTPARPPPRPRVPRPPHRSPRAPRRTPGPAVPPPPSRRRWPARPPARPSTRGGPAGTGGASALPHPSAAGPAKPAAAPQSPPTAGTAPAAKDAAKDASKAASR
ncbi:hypothetical protein GXW82_42210 [Streptacidiphilus sp. 4-A2]|nr:hypothetical protein [Streptacidiphilus sp. 4-A2]